MKSLVGFDWPEGHSKQVAYISQDRHIHEFCVGYGGEWLHTDLTMLTSAPLAQSRFIVGYAWPESGTKQVAYLGQDAHIHQLWVSVGGLWQHVDLSELTGAPPAVQVAAGYSWSEGRSQQVVFIGDDDHIHELYVEAGRPWQHIDLTALTNAPLPGSKSLVGYGFQAGHAKQVAYVGRDGHIHELLMEIGKPWQHIDLSELTGAPRAVEITTGYEWVEGHCKQIAYVGADQHIHELCMVAGASWQHADLSSMTSAPLAINVITGFAWRHSKQVAYVGQDLHIRELSVVSGGQWSHADLTVLTNAPVNYVSSIDGFAWSAGNSKQFVYVGDDGQIRELWQAQMGDWTYTDLSEIVSALPARF